MKSIESYPRDERLVMTDVEIKKVIRLEDRGVPSEYVNKSKEECKETYQKIARREKVVLLNIQFAPNLGTVVRTASIWGFGEILTFGKRKYDKRLAIGLYNYIPIKHHPTMNGDMLDTDKVIEHLKEYTDEYILVFIELHDKAISLFDMNKNLKSKNFDKKLPPIFILGDEHVGISPGIINAFPNSLIVQIPQPGIGRSHNVAVAFSSVAAVYFSENM